MANTIKSIKHVYFRYRPLLTFFMCLSVIVGLLLSKVLISIGIITLSVLMAFNPEVKKDLSRFFSDKSLWIFSLIFFLYLVSGIYSTNWDYLLERLRIKLPFLFIPFAFVVVRKLPRGLHLTLLYIFLLIISFVSLGVFTNYLIYYEAINQSILFGKAIPTPVNHIRLSLMCVIAIIAGIYLYINRFFLFHKAERWLFLALVLFLIVFLHVFAVRSGLGAFYLVAFVSIIMLLLNSKRKFLSFVLLIAFLLAPVAAYYSMDSLQNKIHYAQYDIERFVKGEEYEGLSDSKRFTSIRAGVEIIKGNPVMGTGIGDVMDELNRLYETDYPFVNRNTIIHNQYLFIGAGTGIAGLLIALFIFLFPLFYKWQLRHWHFISINLLFLFSFLVEATLEIQIGVTLYLFFIPFFQNLILTEGKALHESVYD